MVSMRFIGDRGTPTGHAALRRQCPVLGSGRWPAALAEMGRLRSVYAGGGSGARPEVRLTQVDDEDVWRVDVPVTEPLRGARAGHTHERIRGNRIAGEVDPAVPYTSFRPGWADSVPVPRLISRPPSLLQRFNRRRGEPLWVYDSTRHPFVDDSRPWGWSAVCLMTAGKAGPARSLATGWWQLPGTRSRGEIRRGEIRRGGCDSYPPTSTGPRCSELTWSRMFPMPGSTTYRKSSSATITPSYEGYSAGGIEVQGYYG